MGIKQSTNGDLKGKTVLITLIENELCVETAVDFIDRGARLIIGCQNPESLINRMSNRIKSGKIDLLLLDLSSESSVKEFANQVKSAHKRIHIMMSSVEIYTHAQNLSYLYSLLLKLIRNSGKLGKISAKMLQTVAETWKARKRKKRKSDWLNSIDFSTIILVSSIPLKHLRGIEKWKFRHERSSRPKEMIHRHGSSRNLEQVHSIGEIARCLEKENCNIILAALNPSTIRTEKLNSAIRGDYLLKWSWFNLGRSTPHEGYQDILYVVIGTMDETRRPKSTKNFSSIFWSFIFWFKSCGN